MTMDKNQIIKWVLIAGAAYLVYRYLQNLQTQKAIASGEQTTQPTPQPGAGVAPANTVAAPSPSAPSPSSAVEIRRQDFVPVGDLSADKLYDYAKGRMEANWDGTLTISQWNWMVSQMTGTDQQTDLSFGVDVPGPVTVGNYLSRRVQAGISGMDRIARLEQAFGSYQPMASGWRM